MAQYKTIDITIKVKESALNGTAMNKELFPTQTHEYTETIDGVPSLKWVNENIVAGLMEMLVVSQSTTTYFDAETGIRVKVDYSIKARTSASISAAGVSKETGAAAVKRGKAAGKKLSKNARRKAKRYGKKAA